MRTVELARWWRLPGPARLARGIANDLVRGASVILHAPRPTGDGLMEAVVGTLELDHGHYADCIIDASTIAPGQYPGQVIQDAMQLSPRYGDGLNGASFARRPDFNSGHFVLVADLPSSQWASWVNWLHEYAEVARQLVGDRRTAILLCSCDSEICRATEQTPAVSVSVWCAKAVCSQIDMLMWLYQVRDSSANLDHRDLLDLAVVAELAGYDPTLGKSLLHAISDYPGFVPRDLLCEYGRSRGWKYSERSASWAEGVSDTIDGREHIHSSFLALAGQRGDERLKARVWKAQISTIMPYLDEERANLVTRLMPRLRCLIKSGDCEEPIELGALKHLSNTGQLRLGSDERSTLDVLWECRNRLAHLQPLNRDQLPPRF